MPAKVIATVFVVVSLFLLKSTPKKEPTKVLNTTNVITTVTSQDVVVAKEDVFSPTVLEIEKLKIKADVTEEGLNTQNLMGVPDGPDLVGWWKHGAKVGEKGNTVLAGHFRLDNGSPGVFYKINELKVGDGLTIFGAGGIKENYKVTQIELYETEAFPTQNIYAPGSPSINRLILITCAGSFVSGNYTKRLVVAAEKI